MTSGWTWRLGPRAIVISPVSGLPSASKRRALRSLPAVVPDRHELARGVDGHPGLRLGAGDRLVQAELAAAGVARGVVEAAVDVRRIVRLQRERAARPYDHEAAVGGNRRRRLELVAGGRDVHLELTSRAQWSFGGGDGRRPDPGPVRGRSLRIEGIDIRRAGELPLGILIGLLDARLEIGDRQRVLDVREAAVEHPEVTVDRPAVQHLDGQLEVRAREEPEAAGIGRQRHGLARARAQARHRPFDLGLKAVAVETEAGRGRGATPLRAGRSRDQRPNPDQRQQGEPAGRPLCCSTICDHVSSVGARAAVRLLDAILA